MRVATVVAFSVLALAGCAGRVSPPASVVAPASQTTFEATYDQTWSALIEYAGSTFFVIDNVAKDSGILTLSFSGSPDQFMDCGTFTNALGQSMTTLAAIQAEATTRFEGKMNVVVRKIDDKQTDFRVNARYIYSAASAAWSSTWAFNTGQSDVQIAGDNRHQVTCRPTGFAEHSVISGVERALAK